MKRIVFAWEFGGGLGHIQYDLPLAKRPRKCTGFKTPKQVFFGLKPSVALATRIRAF